MSNPLLGLLAQNSFDRDGAQDVVKELEELAASLSRPVKTVDSPSSDDGLSMAEAFAQAGLGGKSDNPRAEIKRLARQVEKQQGWQEGSFVGPALKAFKRLQKRLDKTTEPVKKSDS